jgi:kumamolisin
LYNDILQQIINDNAQNTASGSIVSLTWGASEGSLTRQTVTAIDQSLSILTKAEHMSVFVASGDCGAFDLGDYVKGSYG